MKHLALDNPVMGPLYPDLIKKDFEFAHDKGYTQGFLRRRIVLFMDGYRYAHRAAQERWGIPFVFYEFGHDAIKKVFWSDNLNGDAAKVWMDRMENDPAFGPGLVAELRGIIETEKALAEWVASQPLSMAMAQEGLRRHLDFWIEFFELAFLWFAVDPIKEDTDSRIREVWTDTEAELGAFLEEVYRPMRQPLSSVEQRDLLVVAVLEGAAFEAALDVHARKYGHLALHNIDDERFDKEYYRGRAHALKDQAEYAAQKQALDAADEEIEAANRLLAHVGIPEELKQRIEFVRWFMYLRTETIDHFMLVNGAYRPVFDYLSQVFELPIEAVLNMTYQEIIESLKRGELAVSAQTILDRTENGYGFFIGPEHAVLVTGDDIERLDTFCRPQTKQVAIKELGGQPAYRGKVEGIARVIVDRRDAHLLQAGEILVTAMTSPDFVPAMKLSAGIITNEGGVLCHAAIMSRELRKPCIIGTKTATDVIKTGQRVVMDAEQGLIILE